jgi:hypothetical protein
LRKSWLDLLEATAQLPKLGSIQHHTLQTRKQIMQPLIVPTLGGLFALVYLACVIAIIIYVLRLLGRFVCAHERIAGSLDIIARKMRDDAKP